MGKKKAEHNQEINARAIAVLKENGFDILENKVIIDLDPDKALFCSDTTYHKDEYEKVEMEEPVMTLMATFKDLQTADLGNKLSYKIRYSANPIEGYYYFYRSGKYWEISGVEIFIPFPYQKTSKIEAAAIFYRPKQVPECREKLLVDVLKISKFDKKYFGQEVKK